MLGFAPVSLNSHLGIPARSSLQDATVKDLKAEMAHLKPKLYPARQRWSLPASGENPKGVVLTKDGACLAEVGIRDGGVVVFKDLGPQIGYVSTAAGGSGSW